MVWPQEEQCFLTRLAHTREINQLPRRIAQYLQMDNPELAGTIDPEMAAASVLHDFRHLDLGLLTKAIVTEQVSG